MDANQTNPAIQPLPFDASRLRGAGISARFLAGGIDQWKAAGRPLRPK